MKLFGILKKASSDRCRLRLLLLSILIFLCGCRFSKAGAELDADAAGRLFLGKSLETVKAAWPGSQFRYLPGYGYHMTSGRSSPDFILVCDEACGNIGQFEIFTDSLCVEKICPGDELPKVKKMHPALPIRYSALNTKEYFRFETDSLEVDLNVRSGLSNQVAGKYSLDRSESSDVYSFEGFIYSISVRRKPGPASEPSDPG